jgi:hypothetical protein
MGLSRLVVTAALLLGCGDRPKQGQPDSAPPTPDACTDLLCAVVNCQAKGLPPTTITGTVMAPNGTLPLHGINVYVPVTTPLPPLVEGAQCDRCSNGLPGGAIASTVTDAFGNFRLENVPASVDVPVVIQTGKWRRQFTLPAVAACQDTATTLDQTRLPKNKAEGDIPKIAITTGDADTMECLVRKLGIEDTEIGSTGDDRRIHLFRGDGTASFVGGFGGGAGNLPSATTLWNQTPTLARYDITIFSCEGSQMVNAFGGVNKLQSDLDAVKAYADLGGRVFASHWHNIWISGNFQNNNPGLAAVPWNTLAAWSDAGSFDVGDVTIDEVDNPKGTVFADWMVNVGGSPVSRGVFSVTEGRLTANSIVDATNVERWVGRQGTAEAQMFQFTTPVDVPTDQRCGKVVFTDMHVSGAPANLNPYPTHCVGGTDLTPQEKALAFMFFDIASCVGVLQ